MKAKHRGRGWLISGGLALGFFLLLLVFHAYNAQAEGPPPAAPAAFTLPVLPPEELGLPIDEPELSMHGIKTSFYARRPRRLHQGLDLKAKVGMALYAAATGEVHAYWTGGKSRRSGGFTVAIINPQWVIRYLHLDPKASEVRLQSMKEAAMIGGSQPGDPFWMDGEGRLFVTRGVIIGYSGRSGKVAPHLHFQVNPLEGPSVNPLRFFTKAYITEINGRPFLYPPQSEIKIAERQLKVRVRVDNYITNYGPLEVRLFVDSMPNYQRQLVNFNGDASQEAVFELEIPDDKPHTLSVSVVDNQYAKSFARTKVSYLRQGWLDSNHPNQQVSFARAEVRYSGLVEVKGPVSSTKEAQAEEKGKIQ